METGPKGDRRPQRTADRRTLLIDSARLVALLATGAWPFGSADAEPGYPSRPVRVIVPYGPGGVADTTMRIIAERLSYRFGQQFIIDNRPGAGGIVAAKAAAGAPPGPGPPMAGNAPIRSHLSHFRGPIHLMARSRLKGPRRGYITPPADSTRAG